MINPDDPLEVQVAKQAKIIDALIRRVGRRHEIGKSAYSAFQSAITLQGQVWAKTRDLERASTELQLLRFDRERTQASLADALSVMEGGFALFSDDKLQVCNDLFKTLMPDLTAMIVPGLTVGAYFDALEQSRFLVPEEENAPYSLADVRRGPSGGSRVSFVVELTEDRWFQVSQQRTNSGNVIILQTEITDIVRKNRFEKDALIDMQAHYLQASFDHMSLGICTFSHDGEIMIRNDLFHQLLGLPFRLVQSGTAFSDILGFLHEHELVRAGELAEIENWQSTLRGTGKLRQRLRHASGRVLDLRLHRLPDRGFMVDINDVTLEWRTTELLEKRVEERTIELTKVNARLMEQHIQQADVEEELRLAKETAEAAVSSKTRFLAAASHDLLQPVNAAKLLISTLLDTSQAHGTHHIVERLDRSFASMEELLHALLDISRLESTGTGLSPTDFCLGSLMQSVTEGQMPIAAKKGVRLDVVPSSLWVRSDQRYLHRSVQNLVVNAIQYTERGRVLLGCRRRGDKVTLEVWDTGIGISHKDHKRVFDEFTRADNVPPGSGMGLGLSIVDRTCRHMGHVVGLRSKPGVGSVFSIEMDIVDAHPDVPKPQLRPQPDSLENFSLIALVVENDPDVLFATVHKLESWGVSALGARSTAEALEMVRDMGIPPDIILADYQLDAEDTGVHAIRNVRAQTGVKVPSIMITANRTASLAQEAIEYDFTVLPKPVETARLRALIDWMMRQNAPVLDKSMS